MNARYIFGFQANDFIRITNFFRIPKLYELIVFIDFESFKTHLVMIEIVVFYAAVLTW